MPHVEIINVREWADVSAEAKMNGERVHVARLVNCARRKEVSGQFKTWLRIKIIKAE